MIDITDYPGEWLLDLPLLSKSFTQWSKETLQLLRHEPRRELCHEFLSFLDSMDPNAVADDALLQRGHALYKAALDACRRELGLRYLQPGRFLCPGPRGDAPFMWFFPAETPDRPARSTAGALLRDRFEAYKADMRATFFEPFFMNFERQIVLVDVLGAIHAGREAYLDTEHAIADISGGLSYGSNILKPAQVVGAAAYRLGTGALRGLGSENSRIQESLGRALSTRRIERVAFVATKADHVPSMRRDNLRNLVRAIAETAAPQHRLSADRVSYHAVASILSTKDDVVTRNGRAIEVVRGTPVGGSEDRPFDPGDVPSGRPSDSFWVNPFFELPAFLPLKIDPSGLLGIPHLGLDDVLVTLLKDRL